MLLPSLCFGERLRKLRIEKGLQQKELGREFNLSQGAIGCYERGERQPEFTQLLAMANFFDVSVDYILGNSGERRKVEDFGQQTSTELADLLAAFTVTVNGEPLNEADKQRVCDVALGLMWRKLRGEGDWL